MKPAFTTQNVLRMILDDLRGSHMFSDVFIIFSVLSGSSPPQKNTLKVPVFCRSDFGYLWLPTTAKNYQLFSPVSATTFSSSKLTVKRQSGGGANPREVVLMKDGKFFPQPTKQQNIIAFSPQNSQ